MGAKAFLLCAPRLAHVSAVLASALIAFLPNRAAAHPCTDEASPYMVNTSLTCGNWSWGVQQCSRCHLNRVWSEAKYCQFSCHMAGCGYPGDECTSKSSTISNSQELKTVDWLPEGVTPLVVIVATTALLLCCVVGAFFVDWKHTSKRDVAQATSSSKAEDVDPEAQQVGKAEECFQVGMIQVAPAAYQQQQQQEDVTTTTTPSAPASPGESETETSAEDVSPAEEKSVCAAAIMLDGAVRHDVLDRCRAGWQEPTEAPDARLLA